MLEQTDSHNMYHAVGSSHELKALMMMSITIISFKITSVKGREDTQNFYEGELGRVRHRSTQLQIRKTNSAPNFSSQTRSALARPPWICSKKRWSRPQLHGFGGVPQEVLHNTKFGGG
jgi:hypothetical protein